MMELIKFSEDLNLLVFIKMRSQSCFSDSRQPFKGLAVFCSDSGTEIDNVLIIFCKTIHWFANMSNTLILYKDITTKHIGYPTQPSPNPKIGGASGE